MVPARYCIQARAAHKKVCVAYTNFFSFHRGALVRRYVKSACLSYSYKNKIKRLDEHKSNRLAQYV